MAAISSGVEGVGVRIQAREIGGEIESCLKLEERLSREIFDSSESSDEGVERSGVFEILTVVKGIGIDNALRRQVWLRSCWEFEAVVTAIQKRTPCGGLQNDDANRPLYAYKTHKWPVWGHKRSEMLWGARTGSPCNQQWVREEGEWGECLWVLQHWGTRVTRVSKVRESYANRRHTLRVRVDDEILLSVRLRLYKSSRVTIRGLRTWGTT